MHQTHDDYTQATIVALGSLGIPLGGFWGTFWKVSPFIAVLMLIGLIAALPRIQRRFFPKARIKFTPYYGSGNHGHNNSGGGGGHF